MKYGIVIFPSKKLQDYANSFRKRYDPHISFIPPHVTLVNPFDSTEEEIKGIIQNLNNIALNSSPFTLEVYKAKTFHPVANKIFLAIKKDEELLNLHGKLNAHVFSNKEKTESFVPHITIGQKLSNPEHSDIVGQLTMMDVAHSEVVDRFHLLYQLNNDQWTTYETFHLRK
ncbi:2'-5' RNA ligase family protein [Schinkia azotoformans]|uniref:2'-5' RNA ligase family protein n=1 Tax=Schinkia azotoformans TaxID=1454 RepID=UPI002DBC2946|nr:2'-5' RNA ligase family protein [Schinkia azotoformans]MEC1715853.1 2'-5' RNA ligase family protein [Schinkia azotoformans]MEC1741492.1 2'-5' RNA ligase family protein [Schinkia azotoformans]MEC1744486.1 2'-5' RNA ligase family protein [Schinkia azotoformans]MEC1758523.1 2'-5' RNA ligase family protein [Schinkia azotoformans]MEC1765325.1 2'-5' RNA ligase family protein [Schinkia azotoformans]